MTISDKLDRIIELLEALQPKKPIAQRAILYVPPDYEEKLTEWVKTSAPGFYPNSQISIACGIHQNRMNMVTMCKTLNKLGIERGKSGSVRGYKIR